MRYIKFFKFIKIFNCKINTIQKTKILYLKIFTKRIYLIQLNLQIIINETVYFKSQE